MTKIGKIIFSFLTLTATALIATTSDSSASTLGGVIHNIPFAVNESFPMLLAAFSYLAGMYFGIRGIQMLREHVESPDRHPMADALKRFLAGGSFFALPTIMTMVYTTINGDSGNSWANSTFSGATSKGANEGDAGGLDSMLVSLMGDIFVPMQSAFVVFGYIAGIILLMVGISRLLKTEQQGPQGPTGIGTIMTFLMAGCLFSSGSLISALTRSMFDSGTVKTNGILSYTDGMTAGAVDHVHAVISSIIAFALILGWVSLIRSFFILRGVSEGSSQASMMAAITHMIGGVLAINLGSVINAVQNTLGIAQYGITFN